jgi:GNAT superfamily N-acetyltransferase
MAMSWQSLDQGCNAGFIMAREYFKGALHGLFGDYQYWKVYAIKLPYPYPNLPPEMSVRRLEAEDLAHVADQVYADHYLGEEALGYGLFVHGELAAVQGAWWGSRYVREREGRSWKIPDDAVKTNSLHTFGPYRGRGYASLLKRYTLAELGSLGFRRVYARIWHSHRNSIRVSTRVGMKLIGVYIEISPFGLRIRLRIPLRPV